MFTHFQTYSVNKFVGSGNTTHYANSVFGVCQFQSVSRESYPSGYASLTVNGYTYASRCRYGTWYEIHFELPNYYYYSTHKMYIYGTTWSSRTDAYFSNIPYYAVQSSVYTYDIKTPAYYAYTAPIYAYTAPKYYQPIHYRYQTV